MSCVHSRGGSELLVRLILCRDGLFIAGMWPSVVNLKVGDTFLVPSEWCMTELEPGTSAERSIGEKSGLRSTWAQVNEAANEETWQETEALLRKIRKAKERLTRMEEYIVEVDTKGEKLEAQREEQERRVLAATEMVANLEGTVSEANGRKENIEAIHEAVKTFGNETKAGREATAESRRRADEEAGLAKRGRERTEEARKKAEETMVRMQELERIAEQVLGTTEAAGISSSFRTKEEKLEKSWAKWAWPTVGGASGGGAAWVALSGVGGGMEALVQLPGKATAVAVLVSIAIFAGKQYTAWRKTLENYAHKRAVVAGLKGFAEELAKHGGENEMREFVEQTVRVITEHPELAGRNEGGKGNKSGWWRIYGRAGRGKAGKDEGVGRDEQGGEEGKESGQERAEGSQ